MHLLKFTFFPLVFLDLFLIFAMLSYFFEVNRFADLFYFFKQLFFFLFKLLFVLFKIFFEF